MSLLSRSLFFFLVLAAVGAAEPVVRWQVARTGEGGLQPAALGDEVEQQMARRLGLGQFQLTVARITDGTGPAVVSVFANAGERAALRASARAVAAADGTLRWFDATQDGSLLAELRQRVPAERLKADSTDAPWRDLVNVSLYGGMADATTESDTPPPPGSDGSWQWQHAFRLPSGVVEIVRLTSPPKKAEEIVVTRTATASSGEPARVAVGWEQWTISETPPWQPTKRYQLPLALAELRHDARRKYQIGVDLMFDPSPGAQAQGRRLIDEAAAAGYPDAVRRQAELKTETVRSDLDRERAHLER
jgi:hypothetical protein